MRKEILLNKIIITKMIRLLLSLLLSLEVYAQEPKSILLTPQLSDPKREYSGLCKSGSRIMLLPQYPEKGIIYGIDSMDVQTFLNSDFPSTPKVHNWHVKGLNDIKKRIIGYQGFEAATQIEEFLYCTIETGSTNDTCYLIRGVVKQNIIEFDMKNLKPLLKRKREKGGYKIAIENAGFESLTYVQSLKKLLILFEYNNYPQKSLAFLIDLNFTKIDTVDLQSIDFRLTDICEGTDKKLYAINHHWKGDFHKYEPDTLISINGKILDWKSDNYNSIVKLEFTDKGYTITPVFFISTEVDNWEGIIPFHEGFLLVTDEHPTTKLVYFPINPSLKPKSN